MYSKLFVGRLAKDISSNDIFTYFSKVGKVISVDLVKSMNGIESAGYGYVIMNNNEDMNQAILKLNNTKLKGSNIRVVEAHIIDQGNWRPFRKYPYRRR